MVEDNARLRKSLAALIDVEDCMACVGSFGSGEEAMEKMGALMPDVVVMDIHLPGMTGIECVCHLRKQLKAVKFLMLTAYEEDADVFQSILAGAHGYLLKHTEPDRLIAAIREVANGESPMSGSVARRLMDHYRVTQATPTTGAEPPQALTTREQEIVELLAQNLMYKEIASKLNVSFATVRTHVEHIYQKLHVRSRAEAVSIFQQR
jgi:DNA-binding NarL/FixJ family response regulator